jgi:hypothetical protein
LLTRLASPLPIERHQAVHESEEDRMTPQHKRLGKLVGLAAVAASVAVSTATATPNGPGTRFYTPPEHKAGSAASFYSPTALKAQGLRWQAMAQAYDHAGMRPDDRAIPLTTEHSPVHALQGQTALRSTPGTTSSTAGSPNGLRWRDAGIGAAGALALMVIAVGAALAVRKRLVPAQIHS